SSAQALDYRRSQDKEHLCPERVKNAAKKAQGVLTSHPRKPRNVYEREQAIEQAEPNSRTKTLLEQQAEKAKALKAQTEALKTRQAEQLKALDVQHKRSEQAERDQAARSVRERRSAIRSSYAPQIGELIDKQRGERDAFFEAHATAAGRVRNTWEAFKTKEWMREIRTRPIHAIKHMFALAYDDGLQLRDIESQHKREMGELKGRRQGEERQASAEIRSAAETRLERLRMDYTLERSDVLLEQAMDKAKLKAEWKQLAQDRRAAMAEGGRQPDRDADQAPGLAQDGSQKTDQGGREEGSSGSIAAQQSERASTGVEYDPPSDEILDKIIRDTQNNDQSQQNEQNRDQGIDR
ncbi:MAG: hypothetical protein AAFN41_06770, partial [Planctomycetota bacterium]